MAKKSPPSHADAVKPRTKASNGLVIAGVPRVNLLPPSELEHRAALRLSKRWVAGLLATVAAVSALVAGAHWIHGNAAEQVAAEQNKTLDLNTDLAGLSHVSQAIADRDELTRLRADAMGNDTGWRALFRQVEDAIPSGAELTGFELISGANPVAAPDANPDAAQAVGIGAIGRFTLRTEDAGDQHRMIDNLRKLDFILAADAGALSASGDEGFTFIVEFVADQAFYSGDHQIAGGAR